MVFSEGCTVKSIINHCPEAKTVPRSRIFQERPLPRKIPRSCSSFFLNDVSISFNYTFKLLGIIIDFKLTWKPHIQAVQKKISSACGILFNLRNKINIDVANAIYYAIAFPYIHYCNIIWGGSYQTFIGKLFITQKKLVRCILRKGRDTPSNPLFKQLNILKLEDVIKVSSASFVYKSINNLINT